MIIRIDPPIPLTTPRGPAYAHFLIDYGTEHDLLWQVFVKETGESWCIPNRDVRLDANWSLGVRTEQKHTAVPVWYPKECTAFTWKDAAVETIH